MELLARNDTAGSRDALAQAVTKSKSEYVREDVVARVYLRLGDKEHAIEWWQRGAKSNVAQLTNLLLPSNRDFYAPIMSDPRMQAIIRQITPKP